MDHQFETKSEKQPSGYMFRLVVCKACGGTPGLKMSNGMSIPRELPSECPGTEMMLEQRGAVGEGRTDFKGGKWIFK